MKLSLVLIARNEEARLPECLKSAPFADEIIIVDSGSTDKTPQIAASFKARFVTRPLTNFADQKNYAMSFAQGDWILQMDADERVSPELAAAVQQKIKAPGSDVAFAIKRENVIFGKLLRHGSNADDYQVRLIRRGHGQFQGSVHERILPDGPCGRIQAPLLHHSTRDTQAYFAKFDLYTDLDAAEYRKKKGRPPLWKIALWPGLRFIFFTFLKRGFLDGWAGLKFEALSAYYLHVKLWKARTMASPR
ncbi:MAG TPA: glycosyltransferase family 2 protein [Verrucomicrobiae bacterium]|jgi:glycosyltransferase involved in cell wall biosynthesis|nr:glycosyltransferase family 2 protein [Verrucomicrobiae bacterium]